MGYPSVKSDPWKAGLPPPRKRRTLWTETQWRRLVGQARDDDGSFDRDIYPISEQCQELIAEFNRDLSEAPARTGPPS